MVSLNPQCLDIDLKSQAAQVGKPSGKAETPQCRMEITVEVRGVFSTMHQYLGVEACRFERLNKNCRKMMKASWRTEFIRLNIVALEQFYPKKSEEFKKEKAVLLEEIWQKTANERFKKRVLENFVYGPINRGLELYFEKSDFIKLEVGAPFSKGKMRCERFLYDSIFSFMRSNPGKTTVFDDSLKTNITSTPSPNSILPEASILSRFISLRLLRDGICAPKLEIDSKRWIGLFRHIIDKVNLYQNFDKSEEFRTKLFVVFLEQEPNQASRQVIFEEALIERLDRCPGVILEQMHLAGCRLSGKILDQLFIRDSKGAIISLNVMCKNSFKTLIKYCDDDQRKVLIKGLDEKYNKEPYYAFYAAVLNKWMQDTPIYEPNIQKAGDVKDREIDEKGESVVLTNRVNPTVPIRVDEVD